MDYSFINKIFYDKASYAIFWKHNINITFIAACIPSFHILHLCTLSRDWVNIFFKIKKVTIFLRLKRLPHVF